jgi:hypothetical protein
MQGDVLMFGRGPLVLGNVWMMASTNDIVRPTGPRRI